MSRRNIAPFAIIILPILYDLITAFYESRLKGKLNLRFSTNLMALNSNPKPIIQKSINLSFVFLLGLLLSAKFVYLGNPLVLDTYVKNTFPSQAMNAIDIKDFQDENLLNSYTWGGYIAWYKPEIRVFVDGRTDLYGDEIILDWIGMVNANEGWSDLFKKYEINWVLLESDRPIIQELLLHQWELIYRDSICVVLRKP